MKIVFNFVFAAALVAILALSASTAEAKQYYTKRAILTSFFPHSETIDYISFEPTRAQRGAIARRLGYRLPGKRYYFYVAKTRNRIDGYAFIDSERGLHKPITFALALTPDGVVTRQEVMVYREARGDEIRDKRFRKQFVGKTAADACRVGRDIHIVSGATTSSNSMARGVRRALVLFDVAIASQTGSQPRSRSAARTAAAH